MGRLLGTLLILLTAMALADRIPTAAVVTAFSGDVRMQVAGTWRVTEPFTLCRLVSLSTQLKLAKGAWVSFCLMDGLRAALSGPSKDKPIEIPGER